MKHLHKLEPYRQPQPTFFNTYMRPASYAMALFLLLFSGRLINRFVIALGTKNVLEPELEEWSMIQRDFLNLWSNRPED